MLATKKVAPAGFLQPGGDKPPGQGTVFTLPVSCLSDAAFLPREKKQESGAIVVENY